ncbi:MAG TPA: SpoIIE family protein phosphatase [bacterium]
MKRINLSPRTWRLGTTLAVSVVLLFVFLLSIALLTYQAMLRERRNSEVDSAVIVARTMAAQVDRLLADVEGTTFTAALFLGGGPALDQSHTGAYLKALQEQYDILRAVFITDLAGVVIASAEGEGIGRSIASRPYIIALRQGARTVWSDGLVGLQSGEVTVAFARPVNGVDGTTRAFLVAAFYPLRVTARLQASLPRDAAVTLFDRRGFILATTYPVRLTPEQRSVPPAPEVREALEGRPVRTIGRPLPFHREDRYGAVVPVPRAHWALAFGRPLAPLQARLRAQLERQMIAVGIAVILASIVFLIVLQRVVRPLESLARTSAAIARGERPQIQVEPGAVEAGELAAGLRSMVGAIARREDELHSALQNEQAAREAAERAQSRLTFLTEASAMLATSLDYEETLRNLARMAVPQFADWATVDVLDENGRLERLGVAHVDPAKVELAYELQQRFPPDPRTSGVYRVIRSGQPELYPAITDEMLRAAGVYDDERLRLVWELKFSSIMLVPIAIRGETVGVITFVWAESGRTYTNDDLHLAMDLARRAARAVDNARLYRRTRNTAETLQRSLLLKTLPELPGIAIAARYLPARMETEVGGDWYDAFPLQDGRIGLVMGDVAGRGVEAGAVMGQLQNALRAYAMEGHEPGTLMERLNHMMEAHGMATVFYLVFDPDHWTVRYANAGHPPAIVCAPDGTVEMLEGGASLPLGGSFGAVYREATRAIMPGSTIVLYTDGLIELRGEPIDAGMDRLVRAATGHAGLPDGLLDHLVATMLKGEPSADDVALLALRAEALDAAHLHLRFPALPSSLPRLRHALRRWLVQSDIPPNEIFEISVAVSEAFSNAVEHAYAAGDAVVEINARIADGALLIEVQDWGKWRAPRGAHRGRGLGLMRGLMDEVAVTPGEAGTVVRLRRTLRREVQV